MPATIPMPCLFKSSIKREAPVYCMNPPSRKKSPSRCPPRGARLNRVEKPTVHTRTCLPEVRRLRGRARSVSAQGLYFAWSQRDYTEKDEPSSQDMQQCQRKVEMSPYSAK